MQNMNQTLLQNEKQIRLISWLLACKRVAWVSTSSGARTGRLGSFCASMGFVHIRGENNREGGSHFAWSTRQKVKAAGCVIQPSLERGFWYQFQVELSVRISMRAVNPSLFRAREEDLRLEFSEMYICIFALMPLKVGNHKIIFGKR